MLKEKKNDNDFIMVNGAVEFNMVVQHKGFCFSKLVKTVNLERILVGNIL